MLGVVHRVKWPRRRSFMLEVGLFSVSMVCVTYRRVRWRVRWYSGVHPMGLRMNVVVCVCVPSARVRLSTQSIYE